MVWLVNSFPAYKSPTIRSSSKLSRVILTRWHSLKIVLGDSTVTNSGLLGLLAEVLSALHSGHLLPSFGIPEVWQISFTLPPNYSCLCLESWVALWVTCLISSTDRSLSQTLSDVPLGIFGDINKERIFQLIQCWLLPYYYAQDGDQGSCVLNWYSTTETYPSFKNVLSLTSFSGLY